MSILSTEEITQRLKGRARELGFTLVGAAPAAAPTRLREFHQWLARQFAGEMTYLEERHSAYEHPCSILDGCKSLLMLGMPYLLDEQQRQVQPAQDNLGQVARYAQVGQDYHDLIRQRLKLLKKFLLKLVPHARARGVVDTAPLHERDFAVTAGLGWIGKNTLLLNKQWGSYFFLAALLTDQELVADQPHETSHCGTCTACLDACPTDAFVQPYVMDARRCLSYLTIESRGWPSDDLIDSNQQWIFGCDICQEVCPWNRRSELGSDAVWESPAAMSHLDIVEVLQWNEQSFDKKFRDTALGRTGRRGMIRNAIQLAGSRQLSLAVIPLRHLLTNEPDTMLRAAAAWALGKIGDTNCLSALKAALSTEHDVQVVSAIDQALCNKERLAK